MEENKEKIKCLFCKKETDKDFVYCPYCGKRVDGKKECSQCHYLVEGDFSFCPKCGMAMDGQEAKSTSTYSGDTQSTENLNYTAKVQESAQHGQNKVAAGKWRSAFFAYENKNQFIRNGLILLFTVLMFIMLFMPVFKIDVAYVYGGNTQLTKRFEGVKVENSFVDIVAGLMSKSMAMADLHEELNDEMSGVSLQTQEDLTKKGYKNLSFSQKRELQKALNSFNLVKLMRSNEAINQTTLIIMSFWITFALFLAAIITNIIFMILLIINLVKRKKFKFGFVGFLASLLAGILISALLGATIKSSFISVGAVALIITAIVGMGLLFAHNVVFAEGGRSGHLKAIKSGALCAFLAIFTMLCFAPASQLAATVKDEKFKADTFMSDYITVGNASLDEDATAEDLVSYFNEFITVYANAKDKEIKLGLSMNKQGFLFNADVIKTYPFLMVLQNLLPYTAFLAALSATALMALMLLQILSGKYFKSKLINLTFIIPLALSLINIALNVLIIVFNNESFIFQNVALSMNIGAGPIFASIFALGALLFSLIFRHPKKALTEGEKASSALPNRDNGMPSADKQNGMNAATQNAFAEEVSVLTQENGVDKGT